MTVCTCRVCHLHQPSSGSCKTSTIAVICIPFTQSETLRSCHLAAADSPVVRVTCSARNRGGHLAAFDRPCQWAPETLAGITAEPAASPGRHQGCGGQPCQVLGRPAAAASSLLGSCQWPDHALRHARPASRAAGLAFPAGR